MSVNMPTGASAEESKLMSIDVIKEAKRWTARSSATTHRPNTPQDSNMEFFSDRSRTRPPSSFAMGSYDFDPNEAESRPGSGMNIRVKLAPLPSVPLIPANSEPVILGNARGKRISRKNVELITGRRNLPVKALAPGSAGSLESRESMISEGQRSENRPAHSNARSQRVHLATKEPQTLLLHKSHSASSIRRDGRTDTHAGESERRQNSADSFLALSKDRSSRKGQSQGYDSDPAAGESAEQAMYWNRNILPYLEKLGESGLLEEDVCKACTQLYTNLRSKNCNEYLPARRRTSLLSTLFKQLNSGSDAVHLACARIILGMRVRGQNLNTICKMLFRISRDEKSSELFVQHNLIENMLGLASQFGDPLDNYESFVYLTGAIKFLCNNKRVAKEFASKGCALAFTDLMNNTMTALEKRNYVKKEKLHTTDVLIQVTAVLRIMADLDRHQFMGSCLFDHLIQALNVLAGDETLALNISRLVSKLTMYNDMQTEFLTVDKWPTVLLSAVSTHKADINIVVRLCFSLGNVTSKNEQARMLLFGSSSANGTPCLEILSNMVNEYIDLFVSNSPGSGEDGSWEFLDVVNKVIRVIANLSISEQLGGQIASDERCIRNILYVLENVKFEDCEELIINTLTTLNNLSYYAVETSVVLHSRIQITKLLLKVMMTDNMSCVMEVARVFGNITQYPDVRDLLYEKQVDSMMVALLDSDKWQMVYSACGVLINMTSDKQCSLGEQIAPKLVDVLRDFAPMEWKVGSVACQLLWNLCDREENFISIFKPDNLSALVEILQAYLADDAPVHLLSASPLENDVKEYILDVWHSDFCPVAQRLLSKLSIVSSQAV